MSDKIIEKIEIPAGFTVTGFLGATPVWVSGLTGLLELIAVCFAILVGYSTWQLNRARKRKLEKDIET